MDGERLKKYIPLWLQCFSKPNNMMNFLYFQNQQFKYAPLDAPLFLTLQYLAAMIIQLYSQV